MNKNKEQELKKHNAELKIQLAEKARELKIEAGLEKVRKVALKMNDPADMPKVCKTIALQLQSLGVHEIRNVQTAIFYEIRGTYMNYEYYAKHKKTFITETVYTNHKVANAFALQMLKGKGEVYITHIKGKRVKEWIAYQKTTNVFIDRFLEKASSLNYYWHSLGPVALGISTYDPLSEEGLNLFKRFLKVFELAYTRYLDIEQAMTQAKDARIEASLERVRAVAMSMRKPEELAAVSKIIFTELKSLGFGDIRNTEIIINKDTKNSITSYYYSDYGVTGTIDVDTTTHPTVKHWMEELKATSSSFAAVHISEKEMKEWREYRESLGYLPDIKLNKIKAVEYYSYSIGLGALSVSSFKPVTDEQLETLERFKNVFGLAYRRYADVAQAEAQAREALIELALERVRARTMAMHKSDELSETAILLFQQFRNLGEIPDQITIGITHPEDKSIEFWVTTNEKISQYAVRAYAHQSVVIKEIFDAWETHKPFNVLDLKGKLLIDYLIYRNLISQEAGISPTDPDTVRRRVIHAANFSKGLLTFSSDEPQKQGTIELLIRFAKVFEQTYTRFLDLRNAEELAREAQIETGLERVRSRAMAMQNSNELAAIVDAVYKELTKLNFLLDRCIIMIHDPKTNGSTWWLASPEPGSVPVGLFVKDNVFKPNLDYINAWKARILKWEYLLEGTSKKEYDSFLFTETELSLLPESVIAGMRSFDRIFLNVSFNNFGSLTVATMEPLQEENFDILLRFAKVFDSTYTRFNDLKQAEAQARESQIQLALERVRARTMAMQKSDELKDAAALLFQQAKALGIPAYSCGYNIWEKDEKSFTSWMSTQDGSDFNAVLNIPLTEDANFIRYVESKQKGEQFFVLELRGERMQEHYRYLKTIPAFKAYFDYAISMGFDLPETQIHHLANFSRGNLLFITLEPCPEFHDVFKRFAAVFEQTYTRFLDLQRAEAQARESQVQLALERIRARTMAMQKSEELSDVAELLFNQVSDLGIKTWTSGFNVWSDDNNSYVDYVTNPLGGFMEPYTIQTDQGEMFAEVREARKSGIEFFVQYADGERLKATYLALNKQADKNQFGKVLESGFDFPSHQYDHFVFGSKLSLMFITYEPVPEAHDIFKRLGKVFEQTYTRFQDLQRAEAQAREARIEAALERVRSRTMGMQHSNELQDTALLLFKQVEALGVPSFACGFNIWDDDRKAATAWMARENALQPPIKTSSSEDVFLSIYEAAERGESLFVKEQGGEELETHYRYMASIPTFKKVMEEMSQSGLSVPDFQIIHCAFFSQGYLMFISYQPVPEAYDIFKRFAKVFEQTYTRFLDLQRAEAQTREAQIEAALERVRSRTMGMQKSEELKEVIQVVYDQFVHLNILIEHTGFIIDYKARDDMHIWLADRHEVPSEVTIPYFDCAHWNSFNEAKEKRMDFFANHLSFAEKNRFYQDLFKLIPGLPDEAKEYYFNCPGLAISTVLLENVGLYIENFSGIPYSDEENATLMRFGKVFQQTYTRFLDLQRAEAQAREAQIEAALERVRSRTMGMQRNDELAEAASLLFKQVGELGTTTYASGFNIWQPDEVSATAWMSMPDGSMHAPFTINYAGDIFFKRIYEARQSDKDFFVMESGGEELAQTYRYMFGDPEVKKRFDDSLVMGFSLPTFQITHCVFFAQGYLMFISYEPCPEMWDIFKRFGKVFEQTYTRFLDLQKAEAQTREAKIEAALEKVRSKTMAMHNSRDVGNTVATMFDQLVKLGVSTNRCGILIFSDTNNSEVWTAKSNPAGEATLLIGHLDISIHPMLQDVHDAWKNKKSFFSYELAGDDLKDYYKAINSFPGYPTRFKMDSLPSNEIHSDFYFPEGAVFDFTSSVIPEEASHIFKRFAGVFGQTYRRFLDLQKSEAQARESQIEAALEKVRGQAMAMHNSADLSTTASMVFTELRKLGIHPIRCGVGLLNKESRKALLYSATSSAGGDSLALVGWVQLEGHPVLEEIYQTWLNNESYFPELSGEQLKSYYEQLLSGLSVPVPDYQTMQKQFGHFIPFSVGCLYAWSDTRYRGPEIKILKRFAAIIDLTFRRYLELQKSEANAREAVRQASLDRVRAEIASMRTKDDLERITPLIWNELKTLDIPFVRCGVFIMDEEQQQVHTFLSTPDGKAIAAFHLPYDAPGQFSEVVSHWKEKRNYIKHWGDAEFTSVADTLVNQGAIATREQYLGTLPEGGIHLHCLPFLQGMLYVGNSSPLNEDEIRLIHSVADAFSTAYARYEDFNRLEAAKEQVDKTLVDLKQTQQQLVQSEKMASLGELTAGIAHEIQNPLNFVNNFSDVSTELLQEMKTEMKKGHAETAMAIAEDVKENLEKILHHGKRADAIVKGMLQHSRSSTGQKELTDLNVLAEEYLRLAYHGLRAKDKSFNASFNTNFDPSIGKLMLIPQDIGRVLVNLINNAFYAVSERKKQDNPGYEPTVTISTRRAGDKVDLVIADNGNGIPDMIKDKIFQPFFTTKPTGQGTGLGLSLSYDIIKAHGGDIKLKSVEGQGSAFIIQLPMSLKGSL